MVKDTEGLVVARFEHRTSRALDPQLHSHCLILNKVRDPQDGSWRALHGHAVFEEAKTAGMLYQVGLRAELARRLGVSWGPVTEHGQAELAGMPQELLTRFSTRTAEVEAAAEARPSGSATSSKPARTTDASPTGPALDHWVRNHDGWRVVAVDHRRGTLEVEHLRHHARLTLPADYVAQHVRLGYASTIASAQGLTVDETHVVVTPGLYASELYTALSRGRHANHAYAICDQPGDTHMHSEPDAAPTPVQVLARVAQRERPGWAAHSVLRRAMTHPEHPDVIRERTVELVHTRMRMSKGPERDALDDYREQLAAHGRAQLDQPTPDITRRSELTRPLAPEPRGLGIDL